MSILDQVKNYLSEAVYGKVVTFYHRTKDEAIEPITKSGFEIGRGDFYGPGVYGCFELVDQFNQKMTRYGDYIVKSKTNVDRFIILDETIARKVYGDAWLPEDQFKLFCDPGVYNNTITKPFLKFLKNYIPRESTASFAKDMWDGFLSKNRTVWKQINGLIYVGGRNDGDVIIVYDTKNIIPMGWALASAYPSKKLDDVEFKKTFDDVVVKNISSKQDSRLIRLGDEFFGDRIDGDKYILKAFKNGFKIPLEDIAQHASHDLIKTIASSPELKSNVVAGLADLNYAIQTNNLEMVKYVASVGAKPDMSSLNYAIDTKNLEIVKLIASLGAKPNDVSLRYAINTKNLEIVKLIASLGAKPDDVSLEYAINTNNLEIVKYVASLGAEPNADSLTGAIYNTNNLEIVKYVASLGAKPTENSLNSAIETKNLEIVKFVASLGAEPNQDSLFYAIDGNDIEMVKYVVSLGAKPNDVSLRYAIETKNLEMVKYVASLGAELTRESLNYAIRTKNGEIVKYVISLGGEPNTDSLYYAISTRNLEIVKLVASIGAKPVEDSLNHAIQTNNPEIVKYVASLGGKPGNFDHDSFHYVIRTRNLDMIKLVASLMIKYGFKFYKINLDWAIETDNLEIVKYVASLGVNPDEDSLRISENPEIIKYLKDLMGGNKNESLYRSASKYL